MSQQRLPTLNLPTSIITRRDLGGLVGQFEQVHSDLGSRQIKTRLNIEADLPKASSQLIELIKINSLDVHDTLQREVFLKKLRKAQAKAPVFHVRLASQLSSNGVKEVSAWFRSQVHPMALLDVGVQPGLVGGIHVRSENQIFDLSWRQHFKSAESSLRQQLRGLVQ